GLARPGRADQDHDLPLRDVRVHSAQHLVATEPLVDPLRAHGERGGDLPVAEVRLAHMCSPSRGLPKPKVRVNQDPSSARSSRSLRASRRSICDWIRVHSVVSAMYQTATAAKNSEWKVAA